MTFQTLKFSLTKHLPIRKALCFLLAVAMLAQSIGAPLLLPPSPLLAPAPIYLLQDIHGQLEAQRSIQSSLEKLRLKNGGTLKVGIEGASGTFDFSPYRFFPDKNLSQQVAEQLLEEEYIAGSELAGFLNSQVVLHGIESPRLYIENVKAYRNASLQKASIQNELEKEKRALAGEKSNIFSADLKIFDAAVEGYRRGELGLGEYVDVLAKFNVPLPFSLEIYKSARESEKTLSFSSVEIEKSKFIAELSRLFQPHELDWLRGWSANTERGEGKLSRPFEMLLHAAQAKGVDLKKYPLLHDYVRYLKLTEAVEAERLFQDIDGLESEIYAQLSHGSEKQTNLIRRSRQNFLLQKLIRFELSPIEWAELKKSPEPLHCRWFLAFYEAAEGRNTAIANSALKNNLDAIVVGGFHTPGLKHLFESAGRRVDIVRPRVSHVDTEHGAAYLNVFSSEKTPLERLLLKWKLLLAPPASLGTAPIVEISHGSARDRFSKLYLMLVKPDLRGQAKRAVQILSRGVRSTTWLSETILFLGPLALGLGRGDAVASFLGGIAGAGLFVFAHYRQDRYLPSAEYKTRLWIRFWWAGLFNLSYLTGHFAFVSMGVPLVTSSLLGFIPPLALHYFNHLIVKNPDSDLAQLVVQNWGWPVILMSTIPDEPGSGPIPSPLTDEAKDRMAAAIGEWRKDSKRLRKQKIDETDPVVKLLKEFIPRLQAMGDVDRLQVARGFAYGMQILTPEEHEYRAYHDNRTFYESAEKMKASSVAELQVQREILHKFSQSITAFLATRLKHPVITRIADGQGKAVSDYCVDLVRSVVGEWRKSVKAGDRIDKFDDAFKDLWLYLSADFFNIEYAEEAQPGLSKTLRIKAALAGFLQVDLTPEEVEHRLGGDAVNLTIDAAMPDQARSFVHAVYSHLHDTYSQKGRSDHNAAAFRGLRLSMRRHTRWEAGKAFHPWRQLIPAEKISSPFEPFLIDFWRTMNQGSSDREHRRNLIEATRLGLADELVASHLSSEEFGKLMDLDIQAAYQLMPYDLKNPQDAALRMALPFDRINFAINTYRTVALDLATRDRFRAVFNERLTAFLTKFLVEATRKKIELHRNSIKNQTNVFLFDPFYVFHIVFMSVHDLKELDYSIVLEAVSRGFREAELSNDEYRIIVNSELVQLLQDIMGAPEAQWRAQLALDVFQKLADEEKDRPAIEEKIAGVLDLSIPFEGVLTTFINSIRAGQKTLTKEASVLAGTFLHFFTFALTLLTHPRLQESRERMRRIVQSAGMDIFELKKRINEEIHQAMATRVSPRASAGVMDWSRSVMVKTIKVLSQFHRDVADDFDAAGQPEKAAAVRRLTDLRENAERQISEAIQQWRASADAMDPDPDAKDSVTAALQRLIVQYEAGDADEARSILLGISIAYRDANLQEQEIKFRSFRDMNLFLQARLSKDVSLNKNPFIGRDLYAIYALMVDMNGVHLLSEGLNMATLFALSQLTGEGIKRWRERVKASGRLEEGDDELRNLFANVQRDIVDQKEIIGACVEMVVQNLAMAQLNEAEVLVRVKRDFGAITASLGADPKTAYSFAVAVYFGGLLDKHYNKPNKTPDPRAERVAEGLLDHYEVVAERQARTLFKEWKAARVDAEKSSQYPLPLAGWETLIAAIVDDRKLTLGARSVVLHNISAGVAQAAAAEGIAIEDLQEMYKTHLVRAGMEWYSRGFKEIEKLRFVESIYRKSLGNKLHVVTEEGIRIAARIAIREEVEKFRQKTQSSSSVSPEPDLSLYCAFQYLTKKFSIKNPAFTREWATGLIVAGLTPDEHERFFTLALKKGFDEAAMSDEGVLALKNIIETANWVASAIEKDKAAEAQAVRRALEASTDVSAHYKTALQSWKESGSRNEEDVLNKQPADTRDAMLRLLILNQVAEGSVVSIIEKSAIRTVIDQELNTIELYSLSMKDLLGLFSDWAKIKNPKEADAWPAEQLKLRISSLLHMYYQLAEHYKKSGEPNKAEVIMRGLFRGMEQILNSKESQERRGTSIMVTYLFNHAGQCNNLDCPDSALLTVGYLKRLMVFGAETKDLVRDMLRIQGESHRRTLNLGEAIRDGLEAAAAIDHYELTNETSAADKWVEFIKDLFVIATTQYTLGYYLATEDYIARAARYIERYPYLESKLPYGFKNQLQGLRVATQMYLEKDVAKLPAMVIAVEDMITPLLTHKDVSEERREFLRWVVQEANKRACLTGDRAYYERMINVSDWPGKGDFDPMVTAMKAEALAYLIKGSSDKKQEYFEEGISLFQGHSPTEYSIEEPQHIYFISSYGMLLMAIGKKEEALVVLRRVYGRLSQDDRCGIADVESWYIQCRRLLLTMAGIRSGMDDVRAVDDTAELLAQAFQLPDYQTPHMDDVNFFLFHDGPSIERVSRAVDKLMLASASAGFPYMSRIRLALFIKKLTGTEIAADKGKQWNAVLRKLKVEPPNSIWPKNLKEHVQKILTEAAEKVLSNHSEPQDDSWPGEKVLRWDFIRTCVVFDMDFKETLKNQDIHKWVEEFAVVRSEIHFVAGTYARAGMAEEAEILLRYAAHLADFGRERYLKNGRMKRLENQALIIFPAIAGNIWRGIVNAIDFIRNKEGHVDGPIDELFMWAARQFESIEWSDGVKLTRAVKSVIDSVENAFDIKVSGGRPLAPHILNTLSRLYAVAGDPITSRRLMQRAALGENAADPQLTSGILNWIPYIMRDPALSYAKRLDESESLLVAFHTDEGSFPAHSEFRYLLLQLARSHSSAAEMKQLVYRFLKLLTGDFEDQTARFIELGLPFHLAQVAYFAGPDSDEAQELIGVFDILENLWIGEKSHAFIKSAKFFYETLAAGQPERYLSDEQTARSQALKWPAFANVWRMTAAFQAELRNKGEPAPAPASSRPDAKAELRRLLMDKVVFHQDSYHIDGIIELLMESPLARTAFIETTLNALQNYDAAFWGMPAANTSTKNEPLRRLILVASALGDSRILMAFDSFIENPSIPESVKEMLARQNGVMAQMELALSIEEWVERIDRMGLVPERRLNELIRRIEEILFISAENNELVRAVIKRKRDIISHGDKIKATLKSATALYNAMRFEEAVHALESLPGISELPEVKALRDVINRAIPIWQTYQAGDFKLAVRMIDEHARKFSLDSVLTTIKERVTKLNQVENALRDRRPSAAAQITEAIVVDPNDAVDAMLDTVRARVITALDGVAAILVEVKKIAEKPTPTIDEMELLRKTVRRLRGLDTDHTEALDYLLARAKTHLSEGRYQLAQELAHVIFSGARLWQDMARGGAFATLALETEKMRKLARAHEMKEWLTAQYNVLKTETDAVVHLELGSNHEDSSIKGRVFQFEGSWEINNFGMFVVKNMSELKPTSNKDVQGRPIPEIKKIENLAGLKLTAGFSFLVTIGSNGNAVRIPMTFVRPQRSETNGEALLFQPDSYGIQQLQRWKDAKEKPKGTLVYLEELQTVTQSIALDRTISYLVKIIGALEAGKTPVADEPILDRLFGINISPQSVKGELDVNLDIKFMRDASQREAIQAGLELEVVGIQGPPGTGKTTTAAHTYKHALSIVRPEDIRRLATPANGRKKGEIVVLTAQAHAGVDNMAFKLLEENVAIVRSASNMASVNITQHLQPHYQNRLLHLWGLIKRHYVSGEGFAYLATNNGLMGDHKCLLLLQMYLNGAPMSEIEMRYRFLAGTSNLTKLRNEFESVTKDRNPIRPVWAQEEAGQANTAETMVVYFAIRPSRCCFFGDHNQLPPHGVSEWTEKIIKQAIRAGFVPAAGNINSILSERALAALGTSLFEVMYAYAQSWAQRRNGKWVGGSVSTQFLAHARRSHWLITEVVNLFYSGRLMHRDHWKRSSEWEKIGSDTVVVVETDGQETSGESFDVERGDELGLAQTNPSKRNFREVGEVIRTITYYLNIRSPKTGDFAYKPSDLLILTPYKSQNNLINETLKLVAILNDMAKGESIKAEELTELTRIVSAHTNGLPSRVRTSVAGILQQIQTKVAVRQALAGRLLEALTDIYDLSSDEDRKIRREDVKQLLSVRRTNSNPQTGTPLYHIEEGDEDTIDQQEQNVLEAKTVHRVQGQEKPVVILSLVRSGEKAGFLAGRSGDQILNVAISRAKEKLAIISSKGLRLRRYDQIKEKLTKLWPEFRVLETAPGHPANNDPPASLRNAWNLNLGTHASNERFDRFIAPPLETVIFFSLLTMGLSDSNNVLIVMGTAVQFLLFPALHVWGAPDQYHWKKELGFSGKLVLFYLVVWFVQAAFIPGAGWHPEWIGLLPVVFMHVLRNRNAVNHADESGGILTEALSIGNRGIDALEGIGNPAVRITGALPPVGKAPHLDHLTPALHRQAHSGA